jgi:hypothetical protein
MDPPEALAAEMDGESAVVLEGTYSLDAPMPVFVAETSSRGIFHVVLQGRSWIINYSDFSAATNSHALYSAVEGSCDGMNTYFVRTTSPALASSIASRDANNSNGGFLSSVGHIYSGVYPPTSETFSHILWLAFASSGVLSSATGMAKPVISTDLSMFYNSNFACNYSWITNAGHPRELVFKSEGRWFQRKRGTGELGFIYYDPPYQKGFRCAEGDWLQVTNIGGIFVPTKYEFSAFMPALGGTNAAQLRSLYTFKCSVTNVHRAGLQYFPPDRHEAALVSDHRFAERGYATVSYLVTKSWPTVDNPDLAEVLSRTPKISMEAAALRQLGYHPVSGAAVLGKKLMRLGILLLLILPLGSLAAKGFFKQLNKRNNQVKEL